MAEEEKETEAAPEEKKKKSPIVLIIVLVVVGLALAGGISFFVTTKLMADTAAADPGVSKHHDPGVFVKLGDPKEGILVNVGGAKASKFLKTSIILEMNPAREENVAEGKLPKRTSKSPSAIAKLPNSTKQLTSSKEVTASKAEQSAQQPRLPMASSPQATKAKS